MMGTEPELIFAPIVDKEDDKAENKRILFDHILGQAKFWSKCKRALVDATVGKRVLIIRYSKPWRTCRCSVLLYAAIFLHCRP